MRVCHKCRRELEHTTRILRSEECPWCLSGLHSCKNCTFYSPGHNNDCLEVATEPVRDRDKSNYCGSFRFMEGEREEGESEVDQAKAKLDSLFKF